MCVGGLSACLVSGACGGQRGIGLSETGVQMAMSSRVG